MSIVKRVWKRDGDENCMDLEVAVKNLGENAVGYPDAATVAQRRNDCRKRLLSGQVVETPLAFFVMR